MIFRVEVNGYVCIQEQQCSIYHCEFSHEDDLLQRYLDTRCVISVLVAYSSRSFIPQPGAICVDDFFPACAGV